MPWSGDVLGLTDLGFVAGRSKPIVLAIMGPHQSPARLHCWVLGICCWDVVPDQTISCDSPAPARLLDGRWWQALCAGSRAQSPLPSRRTRPVAVHGSRDCCTWPSSSTRIIAGTM